MKVLRRNRHTQFLTKLAERALDRVIPNRQVASRRNIVTPRIGILAGAPFLQQDLPALLSLSPAAGLSDDPCVDRLVRAPVTVGDSPLPDQTAPGAVLVQDFEQFHGFSIQNCRDQTSAPVVHKLERKEWVVFIDQTEKDLISLPDVELPYLRDVHPLQLPFVAGNRIPLEAIRCKKMHILRDAVSRYKGHDSPESPGSQCVAGLLPDLAQQTLLRTLIGLKVTADPDPFVLIDIIFLDSSVQHQIFSVFFHVA